MNESPLVSVVIPMYNAERYIRATLESVLKQTYKNIEIIVVNNCSTDGSAAIVASVLKDFKRCQILETDFNSGGPARPRNVGIQASRGEFIAFLDADDIWLPEKLQVQIPKMLDLGADFSSTDIQNFSEEGSIRDSQFKALKTKLFARKASLRSFVMMNTICLSSAVIRRATVKDTFDEDKCLVACEDYYFWLKLFGRSCKYVYCKSKLVEYRVVNSSISERSNKRLGKSRHLYALVRYMVAKRDTSIFYLVLLRFLLSALPISLLR